MTNEENLQVFCSNYLFEENQVNRELRALLNQKQYDRTKEFILTDFAKEEMYSVEDEEWNEIFGNSLASFASISYNDSYLIISFLHHMIRELDNLFAFQEYREEEEISHISYTSRAALDLTIPHVCEEHDQEVNSSADITSLQTSWPHSLRCRCSLAPVYRGKKIKIEHPAMDPISLKEIIDSDDLTYQEYIMWLKLRYGEDLIDQVREAAEKANQIYMSSEAVDS